eukprot:sb/3470688/
MVSRELMFFEEQGIFGRVRESESVCVPDLPETLSPSIPVNRGPTVVKYYRLTTKRSRALNMIGIQHIARTVARRCIVNLTICRLNPPYLQTPYAAAPTSTQGEIDGVDGEMEGEIERARESSVLNTGDSLAQDKVIKKRNSARRDYIIAILSFQKCVIQSDPHLVTSSGERVLVTKSGWALNRGQIPLISSIGGNLSCH